MATNTVLKDANRDPITGEPGSHPVGTALGTAAGAAAGIAGAAAAGAAAGTVAGPLGTVAGAIVGGLVGAAAGKGLAEAVDPTAEDAYWSDTYNTRPYVSANESYDTYRPAYHYGVDAYGKYQGKRFDEIEPQLQSEWENSKSNAVLPWKRAKDAARDSYSRIYDRKNNVG